MTRLFSFTPKPKIWTVLLTVNLTLLLLPLAGIWGFRLYETELIRRTEAELISQTVLLKELFLMEFDRLQIPEEEKDTLLGPLVSYKLRHLHEIRPGQFRKIYPRLDIYRERKRDPILDDEAPAPLADNGMKTLGEVLGKVIDNAQFNLLSGIRILSADGKVIASTTGVTGQDLTGREEVRRALTGEPLSLIRQRAHRDLPTHSVVSYGTGVIVFVAQPVVKDNRILGAIVASRTPTNLANAINEHRHHLIRFVIILAIIVALMTILTVATIGGPIRRLAKMTTYDRKAGRAEPIKPLKRPGTAEVAALSEAFVNMSRSLHERADYTEGLVRSVSHEFKTPIASINASVEILEDHLDTMSPAERKKFLSMIGKDSLRLQSLVERLLELARADAIMNPEGSCNAAGVLHDIRNDFKDQCRSFTLDMPLDNPRVAMPEEAFYSCLSNIVGNSICHVGPQVQIHIAGKRQGDELILTLSDDGPGIDPLDRPKIFEPFYTTARAHGGTGLGLSIVKSLAEAYGGSIKLSVNSEGTTFVLTARLHA